MKFVLYGAIGLLLAPASALATTGCNKEVNLGSPPACSVNDSTCQRCASAIQQQTGKMKDYNGKAATCTARQAACSEAIKAGTALPEAQKGLVADAKSGTSLANQCKSAQAKEDAVSAKLAQDCKKALQVCQTHAPDALKACKEAETLAKNNLKTNTEKAAAAGKNAATNAANEGNLGDLAKLAQMAGPLAQMLQGKGDDGSGMSSYPTSEYPEQDSSLSEESDRSETGSSQLAESQESDGVNGVNFAMANPSTVSTEGVSRSGAYAPAASSVPSDGRYLASADSSGLGAGANGGQVGSTGGGASSAGASSGNSSGASKMKDSLGAQAGGKGGEGYEMNMKGGGKLLGLKSSKEELEELTNQAADNAAAGADGAKLDELAGGGAGAQMAAAEGLTDESIFLRVRKKLSTCKLNGRL